jgi:hypothetical protein
MATEIFTRSVPAIEAPSIVPPGTPTLVPGRPEDIEKLSRAVGKYPMWRTVLAGPARSRQEEKWYRALVGIVADGIGIHPDRLHAELRFRAGKITGIIESPLFGVAPQLKSSRDMDDAEFHAFVSLATDIIFLEYLPGVRRKDVLREVERLVGPRL